MQTPPSDGQDSTVDFTVDPPADFAISDALRALERRRADSGTRARGDFEARIRQTIDTAFDAKAANAPAVRDSTMSPWLSDLSVMSRRLLPIGACAAAAALLLMARTPEARARPDVSVLLAYVGAAAVPSAAADAVIGLPTTERELLRTLVAQ
jgi:hypothetical protein